MDLRATCVSVRTLFLGLVRLGTDVQAKVGPAADAMPASLPVQGSQ